MEKRKRKAALLWVGILLMLLLGGCGAKLDQKIASVQEKNEITVQDVIALMQLEGLDLQQQTPSTAFAAQWPEAAVYKVNGENLLLLQSFEENLSERQQTLNKIGWDGSAYFELEDAAAVVKQAAADFQPDTGQYMFSKIYSGKNIVAWYVIYWTQEQPEQEELNAMSETWDLVEHVFQTDINAMQTELFQKEGDNFGATLRVNRYRTPFTADGDTMFDCYMDVRLDVELSAELLEQYQGQEISVETEGPTGEGYYGKRTSRTRQTVDAAMPVLSIPLSQKHEMITFGYEGPYQFKVTVSVGDKTETVSLGSENNQEG